MNEYVALDGRTVDQAEACDARGVLRPGYGLRRKSLLMMDSVQSDIHRHNLRDAGVGRVLGCKLFFGGQSARPAGARGLHDAAVEQPRLHATGCTTADVRDAARAAQSLPLLDGSASGRATPHATCTTAAIRDAAREAARAQHDR